MPKIVRQMGRALWFVLPLLALALFVLLPPKRAMGGTYTTPYWTNTGSVLECACDASCCEKPPVFSPEGDSHLDGHLQQTFFLFDTPGRVSRHAFGLTWSARISGVTQMGRSVLPSWEHTLQTDATETPVYWRRPDGLAVTFTKSGSTWSTADCNVHWTLAKNGSGRFVLTSLQKRKITFDASLMSPGHRSGLGPRRDSSTPERHAT
jgi:hypothetical protein